MQLIRERFLILELVHSLSKLALIELKILPQNLLLGMVVKIKSRFFLTCSMQKKTALLFIIFLVTMIPFGSYSNEKEPFIGASVSQEDLEGLRSIFFKLFYQSHFAYTLFGDKPVSLSGNFLITPLENRNSYICASSFWKNWDIWKKYKATFPIKNYLFIEEDSTKHENLRFVFFINKKEFIKCVNKNIKIFKRVLKRKIVAEELLEKIATKKIGFQEAIENNDLILGILLGYGKHNPQLYAQREQIINANFLCTQSSYEYESLNKKLRPFSNSQFSDNKGIFPEISSVQFVADLEHPETIGLQKKYTKLRQKLFAIYSKGDFLVLTLKQLTD